MTWGWYYQKEMLIESGNTAHTRALNHHKNWKDKTSMVPKKEKQRKSERNWWGNRIRDRHSSRVVDPGLLAGEYPLYIYSSGPSVTSFLRTLSIVLLRFLKPQQNWQT